MFILPLLKCPETELQRMCTFLGVSYDSRMMGYSELMKEVIESDDLSATIKQNLQKMHAGLTKKISTEKVGRWKSELSKEQQDKVWSICAETASHFGYEAEGCNPSVTMDASYYKIAPRVFLKRSIQLCYFHAPSFARTLMKNLKYGKGFKTTKWVTADYYEKSIQLVKKS